MFSNNIDLLCTCLDIYVARKRGGASFLGNTPQIASQVPLPSAKLGE